MNHKPETKPRHRNHPRRHVPLLIFIPDSEDHHQPAWKLSVRDHRNALHTRLIDTWVEVKHTAEHWAHVNEAHGCRIYGTDGKQSWN